MTQTIGFIGLGLMGAGFTKRLVSQGCAVVGHDIDAAKLDAAKAWGVEPAASPAEVARRCDLVCLCVTTTKAVAAVVSGDDGIVSAGKLDGKVIVDFSTTEMATTKSVAAALADAGAKFIDGPVSGGPPAAEAGTLAIMAGGDDDAIDAAVPVLKLLGQVTHMGPTGAGQATKLVNQALCLTNYCIVAEGLRIAQAYGVDAAKIPEALAPGLGNSAVLQAIYPRMVAGDFAPRGYARQILKDLEMLHEATREQHIATPMTTQALTMFRILVAQGHSELDGAAIVTLLPEPEPLKG
jgi:3-hydroxyisobutyrate dehydrogenase-like beta-hydroxyacid dehydrogenase